jgi:dTMP kinase
VASRRPRTVRDRAPPAEEEWKQLLDAARRSRQEELDERERVRRIQEEESRASHARWQQERERRRLLAEDAAAHEAQLAAERRRKAEEERRERLAEEQAIKLSEARERLLELSLRKCPDRAKVDLWLKVYDPKLRGKPWDLCADYFPACEKRLREMKFP